MTNKERVQQIHPKAIGYNDPKKGWYVVDEATEKPLHAGYFKTPNGAWKAAAEKLPDAVVTIDGEPHVIEHKTGTSDFTGQTQEYIEAMWSRYRCRSIACNSSVG